MPISWPVGRTTPLTLYPVKEGWFSKAVVRRRGRIAGQAKGLDVHLSVYSLSVLQEN